MRIHIFVGMNASSLQIMSWRHSVLLFLLFVPARPAFATPSFTYTVGMSRPTSHVFEVEVRVDGLSHAESTVELVLPGWRSGRYAMFDFAAAVQRFTAETFAGAPLVWRKIDKSTWEIASGGISSLVVRYLVYADEPTLRTRVLDDLHGFFDPVSIVMYSPVHRAAPVKLIVNPFPGWHVTTGLEPVPGSHLQFTAESYDELADCPVEIGTQRDYEFTVGGIPHVFSIAGRTNCAADSLVAMAKSVVEINLKYWGALPYKRYVFLLRAFPDGGGGTEHMNSCVLDIRQSLLTTPDPCRNLLGLLSHEFFHTWNVKRLRPKGMHPYDWTKENYYRELWLAEGGTSYMDNLLLVRGGLTQAGEYVKGIPSHVRSDRQRPGNGEQSLTECSFDAWIKFSRPSNSSWNFETDFYARGADACLLMDLELRHASEGKASFDDVLRTLYRRFPPSSPGYTVEDIEAVASELGGKVMNEFFTFYIRGKKSLPWERVLGYAGLVLKPVQSVPAGWLGLGVAEEGGRPVAKTVVAGSPAYEAGLDVGDQIVSLNGLRVRGDDFARRIAEHMPGDLVTMHYFRRDELRQKEIVLSSDPAGNWAIKKVEAPDSLQRSIYESWLGCSWDDHGQ